MSENKKHFSYNKTFPDVQSILNRKGKNIENLFKDALFVIDTNSLLVPYLTGKKDIEEIKKIYQKLIKKERLYVPEHSLREFAKNRSFKISNLYTNIDVELSSVPTIKSFEYPILGEIDAYKRLNESREEILKHLKEYKEILKQLKSGVMNWNWSDPVTTMYQETFSEKVIINTNSSEEDLIKEYNERIEFDIPPGNKDKSKEINAIGDFVIWKCILELGKEKKQDVIFVSNDEKNDWLLKGNKQSISTKFELVDEFYRYTNGKQFISLTFSTFLEKQGLDIDIKDQIIFKNFDRIFGKAINKDKEIIDYTTLEDLERIYIVLSQFLTLNQDNPTDYVYIESDINERITHFLSHYRAEFQSTNEWNIYFHYLFLFEEWLKDIKSLNGEIKYQEHRMKRETITEQIKLKALSESFIEKYEEFRYIQK